MPTSNSGAPPVAFSSASLVRAIHAASLQKGIWPEVLEQLRRRFDARVVTLGHHAFSAGSKLDMVEASDSGDFGAEMALCSAPNPWYLSSDDYVGGRVMCGNELIEDQALRRTDFYRRFLQPRGLLHLLCGVVEQRALGAHCVSVYRAESQPAFDDASRTELRELLDHISLSLQNQWRWQAADDLAQALLTVADHDARPTMLVTADAQLVHCNRAANSLLEQGMGLLKNGSCLAAHHLADRRVLQQAIARLAEPEGEDAVSESMVLTLASAPDQAPLVVVLRRAGDVFTSACGTRRPLVAISVRGGKVAHDAARCAFAHQYELTMAQAKVSSLVFAGQSLGSIARTLSLSENTVRSHLKQIFFKTETHGQMELVHLHARVCTAQQ